MINVRKWDEKLTNPEITSYHFLLVLFLLLQPVVDIYRIFVGDAVQIMGLSFPEVLNIGLIAVLSIMFIVRNFQNRKIMLLVGIYGGALVIYMVAHCINVLQFNTTILNGAEHNLQKELYFMVRVYLVPILYLIILLTEKIKGSIFQKAIMVLAASISGIIVLTNLFGVGFITYASTLQNNDFITRTVLEWFTDPDVNNPAYMACKGWFYTGNQISIILFMLFPFVIQTAFKNPKPYNYVVVVLQAVSMIMVGTKVAAVGALLIVVAAVVIYLVFTLLKRQIRYSRNTLIAFICAVVFLSVLFPVSPVLAIQQERNAAYEDSTEFSEEGKEELQNLLEDAGLEGETGEEVEWDEEIIQQFTENLNKYHNGYGIDKAFITLLPIRDNVMFWRSVVVDTNKTQLDYRAFKEIIYEEVLRKNDNLADRWLGIGYISNFPYTEKDFVSQSVWFGHVGTLLLLGPYIACLVYILIRACKRIKKAFCYENALFAVSLFGSILLSIMAGHLFYGVFSIVIFVWLLASVFHFSANQEELK